MEMTTAISVIPVHTRPCIKDGCFVGMIVQFSRSASRRRPDWADGLSKLNSMPVQMHEPGPVDVRYRVKLEADGMPAGLSPALQILELP